MTWRLLSPLALALVCAWACANPLAALASESLPAAAPPRVSHLDCGGARLTASTVFRAVPDQDRQVVSQAITVTAPGAKAAAPEAGGGPVSPAVPAGHTGARRLGHRLGLRHVRGPSFVHLPGDDLHREPAARGLRRPTREWVRLHDLRGQALNAGFPHDAGPREEALMKRLGLDHAEDAGVSLSDPRE